MFQLITRYSLAWLVIANSVGVFLGVALVWPEINTMLAPYTYGRILPLHLNYQLYGWCSIPLLGVLWSWFLPQVHNARPLHHFLLALWSLVLVLGGIHWLHGGSSGKLFLDWNGYLRIMFPAVVFVQWLALARGLVDKLSTCQTAPAKCAADLLALSACAAVPAVFYIVLSPNLYPAIAVSSGGPTGVSLLESTLGLVAIVCLIPYALKLPKLPARSSRSRVVFFIFVLHIATLAFANHANSSTDRTEQLVYLSSVLIWIPVLVYYFRQFETKPFLRSTKLLPWIASAGVWGILLSITGVMLYIPAVIEIAKFTNVLVAHAHMAMAGMLSSVIVILLTLLSRAEHLPVFDGKPEFYLWHIGLIAMVIALTLVGLTEQQFAAAFGSPYVKAAYVTRLAAGVMMTVASLGWFLQSFKVIRRQPE